MIVHNVRTQSSSDSLARESQLAWKIAALAAATKDEDLDADVVDTAVD